MLSRSKFATTILGLFAVLAVYIVYLAASDIPRFVSTQGCRMSWMSPSYLLQANFNTSWTPLARRYTLWLYREVGWEPNQAMGVPVLFIPGNAGSSHQVRSIASSAARQYFSSPFAVSNEFTGRKAKALDVYAVEFNEDLSAFHGPTLDSQIAYTSAAIKYILSHYPPNTQIIIMGHSMGGTVGAALLPSPYISVLITMSTPHTLPPARFDARIEEIYKRNRKVLDDDDTPILSLCGGATDMMIPSESCVLPEGAGEVRPYRRTVFTSALEGAWTGVGHREMVWCHQVRWRIARAALELGSAKSLMERTAVLDRWLRDGHIGLPREAESSAKVKLGDGRYEVLQNNTQLVLRNPRATRTHLIPIPKFEDEEERRLFVLYASRGSVLNVAPHHRSDLRASVQLCILQLGSESPDEATPLCTPLTPTTLKLLPSPIPGKPFPMPDEGSDESEGVVFFEGEVPRVVEGWVGVSVEASEGSEGWIVAGFDDRPVVTSEVGVLDLAFGGARILLPHPDQQALRTRINIPRLQTNALLVYRLVAPELSRCADTLFPPLLWYNSRPSESHFNTITSKPVYLHSHGSAPYISHDRSVSPAGLNLTIYSTSLGCHAAPELLISIDWWATAGRIGTRYPTTLLSWCIAVASLLLFHLWDAVGTPSVDESLIRFVRNTGPKLMSVSVLLGLLPLGPSHYLGLGSGMGLASAGMAVLLVSVASGMVCVSWWVLVAVMWPMQIVAAIFTPRRPEDAGLRRSTIISMFLILLMIFLFIPWQVAFLGCWFIQLFNSASARGRLSKPYPGSTPTVTSTPTESIPLREHIQDDDTLDDKVEDNELLGKQVSNRFSSSAGMPDGRARTEGIAVHSLSLNDHVLLLMTWLLPLVGPVLVVWVRTLQTAGYTTPFNGDHNIFKITPILYLVDYLGRGRTLEAKWMGRTSLRWGFVVLAGVAFMVGGRKPYLVYDAANVLIAFLLLFTVISQYLS